MTEPKVGNTRVSLETGDPATPGLGWAPGDSVDASAAEEGLGWAGLGTLCRQNRTLFDLLIEQNKQKLQITSFVNTVLGPTQGEGRQEGFLYSTRYRNFTLMMYEGSPIHYKLPQK